MNMRKERSVKWGREEFIIFHWNEYIDDDDDNNFEMFYVYIDHFIYYYYFSLFNVLLLL